VPRSPVITAVSPSRAVGGGRITVRGRGFDIDHLDAVTVGGAPARVMFASSERLAVVVPADLEGGTAIVRIGTGRQQGEVTVGTPWATGLHQVDNPVFDAAGNLFATYSGSRGQEAPISIFRVTPAGTREPFVSGIVNATSMTIGPENRLYVSSRFEGAVYRVESDGTYEQVASDLGVACGLAFDNDGWMYVGDRSGTVFRPGGELFVSAPTLGSYDYVHRVDRHGNVRTLGAAMGRPQGLTFGPDGALYVIDALAGASGLYRVPIDAASDDGEPELVVSGGSLVGVAFGADGQLAVCSNDTVYRFD
jgi:hypothetical protein